MDVTVADVINLSVMEGSSIIAGMQGLSRIVRGFSMLEDKGSMHFLQENSLVLTNGIAFSENIELAGKMIESLHEVGICGILIKFGRHLPEATNNMIAAANACGLPIISLPPHIKPAQLINVIMYEIIRNEAHDFDHSYDTDLLRDLIIENQDWRILKNRLASMGWNARRKMGVVLIKRTGSPIPDTLREICANEKFDYSFPLYDKYVALIDLSSAVNAQPHLIACAESLMNRVMERFPGNSWKMGVGRVRGNLLVLSASYKDALYALCMGIANNTKNPVIPYHSLGVFASLLQSKSKRELEAFLAQLLAALEQYDKQNNTELTNTLCVYAHKNASIKETAEALFVHTNTVRYRVDMIRRIMGQFVLSENISVSLEVLCTFLRWLNVYRNEEWGEGRAEPGTNPLSTTSPKANR